MRLYTGAPACRGAMKIQEVILRAMGKRIRGWQAAEIIGIGDPGALAAAVRAAGL